MTWCRFGNQHCTWNRLRQQVQLQVRAWLSCSLPVGLSVFVRLCSWVGGLSGHSREEVIRRLQIQDQGKQ